MTTCVLVQTEKAYKGQETNTYTLVFAQKKYNTNKIELTKLLRKQGLNPLKVTTTNTQQKVKKRGKSGNKVLQFRPQKYFVRLKIGELINEDTIIKINEFLNPLLVTK